jgi:hypothetical protein
MIHEIGKELAAELVTLGWNIPVVDGPEPTDAATNTRERIVIERDRDSKDSYTFNRSGWRNPQTAGAIRNTATKITVYSKSPAANATEWEHERRLETILDQLIFALVNVIAIRKQDFTISGGKFVEPKDLAGSPQIAGAVYELTLTIARGVFRRVRDEYEIVDGTIVNTDQITGPANPTPVTAC